MPTAHSGHGNWKRTEPSHLASYRVVNPAILCSHSRGIDSGPMINNQYPYSPQQNFAPAVIRPSGHGSAIKIALAIAAGLIALLLGLLLLLLIGIETGPVGLLVGM